MEVPGKTFSCNSHWISVYEQPADKLLLSLAFPKASMFVMQLAIIIFMTANILSISVALRETPCILKCGHSKCYSVC